MARLDISYFYIDPDFYKKSIVAKRNTLSKSCIYYFS